MTEAEESARNKAVVTQFFERNERGRPRRLVRPAGFVEFNDTFHAREFFSLNAEGRIPTTAPDLPSLRLETPGWMPTVWSLTQVLRGVTISIGRQKNVTL